MCLPFALNPATIAGMLASAGGALINSRINNQAITEQNRQNEIARTREDQQAEAERIRQLEFERQQAASVAQALTKVDPGKKAAEIEAEVPETEIANIADSYTVPVLQGQVGSSDSAKSIGRIISGETDKLRGILTAASTLNEQDKHSGSIMDALMRMSSDVQTVGSWRQGSLNASRLETSVPAAEVTRSPSPIGDILMLGGQALTGRAASNAAEAGFEPKPIFKAGSIFGRPVRG